NSTPWNFPTRGDEARAAPGGPARSRTRREARVAPQPARREAPDKRKPPCSSRGASFVSEPQLRRTGSTAGGQIPPRGIFPPAATKRGPPPADPRAVEPGAKRE